MRIKIALLLCSLTLASMAADMPAQDESVKTVNVRELDVKPELTHVVPPVYPYSQNQAGLTGAVTIAFTINPEGRVIDAYIVESNNPAFDRPALDALTHWRYKPGLKKGQPVYVAAVQEIDFRLDDADQPPWQMKKPKDQSSLPLELQWDEAPVPIHTAFPVYPYDAYDAKVRGMTRVSFIVGRDGLVSSAKLDAATTPEFGLAALATVNAWKFKPARKKDGSPCSAILTMEHQFSPAGTDSVPVSKSARAILRLLAKHPEKIIAADKLDHPPKPWPLRKPVYPVTLRGSGQTGHVVIEFYIDEDGDAQLPRIVSSSAPEFGYAAVQATTAWHFRTPTKDGVAVVTHLRVPLEFKAPASSAPADHP